MRLPAQPGGRGGVVAADGDFGSGLVDAHPPGGLTVEPLGAELDDLVAEFGQLRAAAEGGSGGQAPDRVGEVGQVPGHQVVGAARRRRCPAKGCPAADVRARPGCLVLFVLRVAGREEHGAVLVRDDPGQTQQQACVMSSRARASTSSRAVRGYSNVRCFVQ